MCAALQISESFLLISVLLTVPNLGFFLRYRPLNPHERLEHQKHKKFTLGI